MISKKKICLGVFCVLLLICSVFSVTACKDNNKDLSAISSMSVVYAPGDAVVYPDTTFDELKRSIVVSVKYTDGTEKIVTDYAITGTMTVGDSVLTISYKNFTKTITVRVSEKTDETHSHVFTRYPAHAATCTENGNIEYWYCSSCGKFYSDQNGDNEILQSNTVTLAAHTPVIDSAVAATCTGTGLTEGRHCSVCNEVLVAQEVTDALGHSFINYVSNNDATCIKDGTKTAKCDRCDEKETIIDVDSKLGHDLLHHVEQKATCTVNGWEAYDTCSRCDYTSYKEIPALGHTEVVDKAVAATCIKTGLTEGKHCSVCNEILIVQEVTNALGHNLVHHEGQTSTCTENGWNTYDTCSRCDYTTYKEIPALGHTEVVDKAVAATCTETGLTEGKHCSVCNEVLIAQEVTKALSHDFVNYICTRCGEEKQFDLKYTLSADGSYYIVSGIGSEKRSEIVIPSMYNGTPVKEIANSAFV